MTTEKHRISLSLSHECKQELAVLMANMLESHLNMPAVFKPETTESDSEQVHSLCDCLYFTPNFIKEDNHAQHRSTCE